MKKSLSLLLAIAMVFSMFATVAAADELDTQAKFDILKEAGIFEGMPDGSAGLDQEMTRAQFAVIIYRLFEKTGNPLPDAQATFNDVSDTHWAAKEIGAVQNAGYMEGRGNGKFDPSAPVTKQELIKVVVDILGIEIDPEGTVSGNAKPWAQPYVAAAEKAGLVQPQEDYTVNALRGYLVDVTYSAYQQILGAQKVTATAKQTGAKKIEVAFSKAVDDSKAKFAVKNGIITRDIAKVTFSDDKKKAVLELTTRLQNGDSVVTISGVEADDIEAKFQAEDERVTQLKFKSNKLALQSLTDFTKVKVGYQVLNQFGEDASVSYSANFVVSKAGAGATAANGVLTITVPNTNPFYMNELVTITGYLNMTTYVVSFSETLTVGEPSTIDSIEFKGVYHEDNKQLNTASKFDDFYVLIEVKDQYGNTLKASDVKSGTVYSVSNPMIFQIADIVDNKGPNKDQVAVQLKDPVYDELRYEGTNTIRIQSFSGKTFVYDVNVPKASRVAKIALSAPSQVVASNDKSVKIPFVAEDQNGNRVTKYSDLKDKLEIIPPSLAGSSLALKEDYVTKEAYLEFTLPNNLTVDYALPVYLSVRIKNSAEMASVQFNIEKKWVPESISGLKDVSSDLAVGAQVSIEPKHVILKDNYGRDKNLEDILGDYKVVIEAADGNFDVIKPVGSTELTSSNKKVTFTAQAKGGERIKVKLVNTSTNKEIYVYEGFIFNVVDSNGIVEYAVEDIPKLSNKPNREVELKVVGKRSNGSTVVLPHNNQQFTVTTTGGLKYDPATGKLDASGIKTGFDNGELKVKVIVAIIATSDRFEKEVVVSNAELVPATIELKDANNLKAEDGVVKGKVSDLDTNGKGENVILNVFGTLKIKDQFGFEMDPANTNEAYAAADQFTATVSSVDDVMNKTLSVTNNGGDVDDVIVKNLETGDSFTVLFTSKVSGASITVRVVATE